MVGALYDQERRQHKAIAAHAFNRCCPFSIPRLKLLTSATSICACNYHIATDNPYHEACLVEVIEVAVLDTVLRTHVGYQLEPRVYNIRVFVEGSLEVVRTRKTRFKLGAALDEVVGPLRANGRRVTRRPEEIGHTPYIADPGRESSRI